MEAFEDSAHEWNGPAYHTGKLCVERGCERPAGTAWSSYWCQPCNAERMRRITRQLEDLCAPLTGQEAAP